MRPWLRVQVTPSPLNPIEYGGVFFLVSTESQRGSLKRSILPAEEGPYVEGTRLIQRSPDC